MPTEWWTIFAVGLLGGVLPLLMRWSDRILHAALALSTGIFLGAVFLHLLPELAAAASAPSHGDHQHPAHGNLFVWMFALLGVLGVHIIETLAFPTHPHDDLLHHKAVSYAALVGLSIHSFTAGVAYAAAVTEHEVLAGAMLAAILVHKGFETFSLTSVFQLANFSKRRIVVWIVLFSAVTPLGAFAGRSLVAPTGSQGMAVATALATGTFLYVSLCELLPEVFHRHTDRLLKLLLLLSGAGLMALAHLWAH